MTVPVFVARIAAGHGMPLRVAFEPTLLGVAIERHQKPRECKT